MKKLNVVLVSVVVVILLGLGIVALIYFNGPQPHWNELLFKGNTFATC